MQKEIEKSGLSFEEVETEIKEKKVWEYLNIE